MTMDKLSEAIYCMDENGEYIEIGKFEGLGEDLRERMFFNERMALAKALTEWRDREIQKIGWQVKDKELMKVNYMDCITALEGLGLIDRAKSRFFIAEMEVEE